MNQWSFLDARPEQWVGSGPPLQLIYSVFILDIKRDTITSFSELKVPELYRRIVLLVMPFY